MRRNSAIGVTKMLQDCEQEVTKEVMIKKYPKNRTEDFTMHRALMNGSGK